MRKKIMVPIILFIAAVSTTVYLQESSPLFSRSEEVTLQEALALGMEKALEWDGSAVPFYLTSVDDEFGTLSGEQGRRERWNLQVGTPDNKRAVIAIRKGVVEGIYPGVGPFVDTHVIKREEVVFDSPELLTRSRAEHDLLPGKDWANGYHFVLQVLDGKATITVIGLDKASHQQKIVFESSSSLTMN
ncbi:hypothetical protein [Paenibacillus dendritiformis]|uniref:hypothetical protein n=1 Tax=Paenibacillus dendritiformis TaxID=130049 RepID=UPI001F3CE96C|nr:hypothetical protein [Paenibacillus dendritiformis]